MLKPYNAGAFNPFFGATPAAPYGGGMMGGMGSGVLSPQRNMGGFGTYSTAPRGGPGGLRWDYGTGWTYAGAPKQQPFDPMIPILGMTTADRDQRIQDARDEYAMRPKHAGYPEYMPPARPRPRYTR